MNTGIYCIEHTPSSRKYIGSAVRIPARWDVHLSLLRRGSHHSPHLQRAWDQYGEAEFEFRKLLVCSKDDLLMFEQRCIDGYNAVENGFNATRVAGSRRGMKHTEAALAKMRARMQTPEEKTRIRALGLSNRGVKRDSQVVAKRAAKIRGRKLVVDAAGKRRFPCREE
jgi:group I intron endonuclease